MAFLDLRIRDASGVDWLPKLLATRPNLAVVVITAYATYDTAVDAIKRGAVDYLPKPFRSADVRMLAATNRDLERDVRAGRFREDLLFRLNVIEVRVPALRERPEDIVRLAHRFASFFARILDIDTSTLWRKRKKYESP